MSLDETYSKKERKKKGIFYTPSFLAEYVASKMVQLSKNECLSIFDPACGDGQLIRAVLNARNASSKNTNKITNVFGNDIEQRALNEANKIASEYHSVKTKFTCVNTLNSTNSRKFDLIISNPPWGSDLSALDSNKYKNQFALANGQFDIYDIFVEKIISLLKKDGVYGLILPDSLFAKEHSQLRKLLATKTSIHSISRLGEKIFPGINRACAVIIGVNTKPVHSQMVSCFRLNKSDRTDVLVNNKLLLDADSETSIKVPQARFISNGNYEFDIDVNDLHKSIISKINSNSVSIKNFVSIHRGVELSKNGKVVQCQHCNQWLPIPKKNEFICLKCGFKNIFNTKNTFGITSNKPSSHSNVFLSGENIDRYGLRTNRWIKLDYLGINYKNPKIYMDKKILIRKTGVGITATIDYKNFITNQVVFIVKQNSTHCLESLFLEFALAVINSRPVTYYLMKTTGENEWRSHPYLTQSILNSLPIPDLSKLDANDLSEVKKISKLVQSYCLKSNLGNISKKSDIMIEKCIAKLFGLNSEDYEDILKSLKSADSLKPFTRLLNITTKEIFN